MFKYITLWKKGEKVGKIKEGRKGKKELNKEKAKGEIEGGE